jgi:hypothetical protein
MPSNRTIFILTGGGRQDFIPCPLSLCNYCQIWASAVQKGIFNIRLAFIGSGYKIQ